MSHLNMPIYDFGPFRLDSAERILLCNGQHVPLQPKAFETLLALIERHGHIVEKEELMKRVWPDTFVEEVNLAKQVSDLRRIFRQFDSTQEFIATVPKRGYRFVADLKVCEPQSEAPAPEHATAIGVKVEAVNGAAPPAWPSYLQESEQEQELEHPLITVPPLEPAEVAAERAPIRSGFARHKKILVASLAVALALTAALAYGIYRFATSKSFLARFQNVKATRLTTSGRVREVAVSPDGKYIAYLNGGSGAQLSLRLRQVVTGQEMELAQIEEGTNFGKLAFSPDGNYVYYTTGPSLFSPALHRVAILGGTPRKLVDSGVNSSVSFSPDGQRLVFTRGDSSTAISELIIANADGSNEQVFAAVKAPERFGSATWSPDGKILACTFIKTSITRFLMALAVEDGKQTVISTGPWDELARPSWLPDGSGLVINARKPGEAPQLWLISYPTGAARQLTHDLNGYLGNSLSADGRTLVALYSDSKASIWLAPGDKPEQARETVSVTRRANDDWLGVGLSWTPDNRLLYTTDIQNATTVWTMDASGGDQRQLPVPEGMPRISSPKLTPDGRYLLFASRHKGVAGIWRTDADGRNLRQLITLQYAPLTFSCSPDGRWIVYVNAMTEQGVQLWKIGIDGGEPVRLTDFRARWPDVSPDGQRITCLYGDEGLETPLKYFGWIPFDGGPVTKIIEAPRSAIFPNFQFKWTPDGRALAFLDRRDGVNNIWLLPRQGGEPRLLTHFKSNGVYAFAWSRDGQWLALWRGSRTNDVVLLSEVK